MYGTIRKLSMEQATTPRDGGVLTDRWWIVDDEGLYWWSRTPKSRAVAPQCNGNRAIAEDLRRQLYPEARLEQIPVVFVGRWDEEYGYNPFNDLK